MKVNVEGAGKLWEKYKFVGLILLAGVGMLLWPTEKTGKENNLTAVTETAEERDLEEAIADILSNMSGVGRTKVLLTLDSDGERQLAQNSQISYAGDTASPNDYSRSLETVLVDGGDREETVVVKTLYPTYRGALVVCEGGDRAEVKLMVTEAVAALTGLSASRVTVAKWQ